MSSEHPSGSRNSILAQSAPAAEGSSQGQLEKPQCDLVYYFVYLSPHSSDSFVLVEHYLLEPRFCFCWTFLERESQGFPASMFQCGRVKHGTSWGCLWGQTVNTGRIGNTLICHFPHLGPACGVWGVSCLLGLPPRLTVFPTLVLNYFKFTTWPRLITTARNKTVTLSLTYEAGVSAISWDSRMHHYVTAWKDSARTRTINIGRLRMTLPPCLEEPGYFRRWL